MTDGKNVFKINHDSVSLVENLKSTHEEADIRMILHAKHENKSYDRILIPGPDTDLFVLCLLAKFHRLKDLFTDWSLRKE